MITLNRMLFGKDPIVMNLASACINILQPAYNRSWLLSWEAYESESRSKEQTLAAWEAIEDFKNSVFVISKIYDKTYDEIADTVKNLSYCTPYEHQNNVEIADEIRKLNQKQNEIRNAVQKENNVQKDSKTGSSYRESAISVCD